LSYQSLWLLDHPEAALARVDQALKNACEIGQAATLMLILERAAFTHIFCGNYAIAKALADELVFLADGKAALSWKGEGMSRQALALAGKSSARIPDAHLRNQGMVVDGSSIYSTYHI
jgi:hypothetical protein